MAMILAFHKVNKDTSVLEVYIVLLCCCCSVAQSCPTLCGPVDYTCQASLYFTISWSLLKLIFIESVMLSICLDIDISQQRQNQVLAIRKMVILWK